MGGGRALCPCKDILAAWRIGPGRAHRKHGEESLRDYESGRDCESDRNKITIS